MTRDTARSQLEPVPFCPPAAAHSDILNDSSARAKPIFLTFHYDLLCISDGF